MAKKNSQAPADNDQQAPLQEAPAPLVERHNQFRAERRELETELAALDDQLRDAINAGDVEAVTRLKARKAELPTLFISASLAETNARHEIANAEDEANLKRLHAAEAERDKLQAALEKRRREIEAEMAEMSSQLQQANQRVGEAYSMITTSRDLGAANDAGFQRSLSALAGV